MMIGRDNTKVAITIIGITTLGIIYYASRFLMDGIPHYPMEDTFFHLNRLIGMENVWRSPVNFNSFFNNGPMTNAFYPWLTMYPMWIIYRICGNYILAFKLYCLCLTIATLFISLISMEKISGSLYSAAIFAVMYTYSAYRFADMFRREALGESLAMAFMPIVILGVYKIFFENHKEWYLLSIGTTLIAYSHVLSVLMTSTVILLILLLGVFFIDNKVQRLISFIKAVVATVGMSLGALVPIMVYYYNDMFRPSGSGQLAKETAFSLSDILKNSLTNQPTAHGVGLLVIMALFLSVVMITVLYLNTDVDKNKVRIIAVFLMSGIGVLLCTSSILPWEIIGEETILGNIQFIWRLNEYSTILILVSFSWMISFLLKSDRQRWISLGVIIVLAVVLHIMAIFTLHPEEEYRITESDVESGLRMHHAPYFDYSSQKAFEYYIDNGYTLDEYYLDGKAIVPKTNIHDNGSELVIQFVNNSEDSEIDIPVFWYKSSIVSVNGKRAETRMSNRGSTIAELPSESNIVIRVYYKYSIFVIISWILSFCIAGGTMVYIYSKKHMGEKQ